MIERNAVPPAVLVVAALAVALGCGAETPDPPVEREIPLVEPEPASAAAGVRSYAGTVEAAVASRHSFRVQGTVVEKAVRVGADVEIGTLLLRLDASDQRNRAEEAGAARRRAEAEVRQAESEHLRVRSLYVHDHASARQLERAGTVLASAREQLEAARQGEELARRRLADTELRAHTTGRVAEVLVEPGENVQPGMPAISIAAGDTLEVSTGVPAGFVAGVAEGEVARVVPSTLRGDTLEARVVEVGVAPRTRSGLYPVTLRLAHPDPRLRPGMAVRVDFPVSGEGDSVLLLPPEAVGADGNGPFVLAFNPADPAEVRGGGSGTLERRGVRVGRLTPRGAEIVHGLSPDDRVAASAAFRVHPEETVRGVALDRRDVAP